MLDSGMTASRQVTDPQPCSCAIGIRCEEAERLWDRRQRWLTEWNLEKSPRAALEYRAADDAYALHLVEVRRALSERG